MVPAPVAVAVIEPFLIPHDGLVGATVKVKPLDEGTVTVAVAGQLLEAAVKEILSITKPGGFPELPPNVPAALIHSNAIRKFAVF